MAGTVGTEQGVKVGQIIAIMREVASTVGIQIGIASTNAADDVAINQNDWMTWTDA